MGAPKQKWTDEEEDALKSGVIKHGSGKWRTILQDPEFSHILHLRSNVDLKDKWRNLGSSASGTGTREKARIAMRKCQSVIKHDDNPMDLSKGDRELDGDVADVEPPVIASDNLSLIGPKVSFSRLEILIVEAIACLKEPTGSNKTTIATYIEDHYGSLVNFKEMLSAKLKDLIGSGKLIKVKHNYRIAPSPAFSRGRRSSKALPLEERQGESLQAEKEDSGILKSLTDADMAWIRSMTPEEAAAAAAQAVAEAEAAIMEAEEAAREAEAAEADAEAARAFAEASISTLRSRNTTKLMVRV